MQCILNWNQKVVLIEKNALKDIHQEANDISHPHIKKKKKKTSVLESFSKKSNQSSLFPFLFCFSSSSSSSSSSLFSTNFTKSENEKSNKRFNTTILYLEFLFQHPNIVAIIHIYQSRFSHERSNEQLHFFFLLFFDLGLVLFFIYCVYENVYKSILCSR